MEAIKQLVIEKIQLEGVEEELERSRFYTKTDYYWSRVDQVKRRLKNIKYILDKASELTDDKELNVYISER